MIILKNKTNLQRLKYFSIKRPEYIFFDMADIFKIALGRINKLTVFYALKNKTRQRKCRFKTTINLVVLNGEVAVPCNLQPAIAGLIACARQIMSAVIILSSVEASIFRNNFTPNPVRTGREQR